MPAENVKIRIRVGANEIEIEAPAASLKEAIDLIPEMVRKIPQPTEPPLRRAVSGELPSEHRPVEHLAPAAPSAPSTPVATHPEIRVGRDDSLTDVITKMFREPWGRQPRRLSDVREALESYGLIYPKQSVAVALLRLAQSGRLRRFKGDAGEFVYTASTVLATEHIGEAAQETVPVIEAPPVSVGGG